MSGESNVAGSNGWQLPEVTGPRRQPLSRPALSRTLSEPANLHLLQVDNHMVNIPAEPIQPVDIIPAEPVELDTSHNIGDPDERRRRGEEERRAERRRRRRKAKEEKWMKEMRGTLMVVTVLVASVTYQAALSPPGGVWQEDSPVGSRNPHRAGQPVLLVQRAHRYRIFFIFNSLAFYHSLGLMMLLMRKKVIKGRFVLSVSALRVFMLGGLCFFGIAFSVGATENWAWGIAATLFAPVYYVISYYVLRCLLECCLYTHLRPISVWGLGTLGCLGRRTSSSESSVSN